jgi:hypothetical protein
MDDDEEIERLLSGLELPDVSDTRADDALAPRLDDYTGDDWG